MNKLVKPRQSSNFETDKSAFSKNITKATPTQHGHFPCLGKWGIWNTKMEAGIVGPINLLSG